MLNQFTCHFAVGLTLMDGAVRVFQPDGNSVVLAADANNDAVKYASLLDVVSLLQDCVSARKCQDDVAVGLPDRSHSLVNLEHGIEVSICLPKVIRDGGIVHQTQSGFDCPNG